MSKKESHKLRRVRGLVKCGGYLLKEGRRAETVDIIHVAMVDLNGVFAVDLLSRIAAVTRLKGVVELARAGWKEKEERTRASSSVYDVYSGFKQRLRRGMSSTEKRMIEDGEIELGEIYKSQNSSFESVNPVQRRAAGRQSIKLGLPRDNVEKKKRRR